MSVPCLDLDTPLRVLGLLFDSQLNFKAHATYLRRLAEADRQALVKRRHRYPMRTLKHALRSRTVARIAYAVDTYYPHLDKTVRESLESAIARCCKAVLSTHSSSSNIANVYECGLLTLSDLARRHDIRRRLEATALPPSHPFHKVLTPPVGLTRDLLEIPLTLPYDSTINVQNVGIHCNHVAASANSAAWLRKLSSEKLLSQLPPPTLEVWTDGSAQLINGTRQTGSATMLWRGDHLVTSSTGSAGDNASSFAAENHALHLALNGIQQCHVSTDIVRIVTDSLSNVVMLAKGPISQTTPQGMLLWQRLIDIASHVRRIDIAFVFGHCGLPRGDTVDLEAKRAVAITSSPPPISFKEMLNAIFVPSLAKPAGYRSRYVDGPDATTPDLPGEDLDLMYALRRIGLFIGFIFTLSFM
eukprot:PhM_4_TR2075/c4_g2_i5/m.6989